MKLEHHFANEGKDEPILITIPKAGICRSSRLVRRADRACGPSPQEGQVPPFNANWFASCCSDCDYLPWLPLVQVEIRHSTGCRRSRGPGHPPGAERGSPAASRVRPVVAPAGAGEVRIAAGRAGAPYVDVWGRRWEADRYYEGGVSQPGPKHFFPPVPDEGLFKYMREAISADMTVPQSQRQLRYDIPVRSGVYELRLYFADPLRQPEGDQKEDAQNRRHFQINLNGHPLLGDFDAVADAGAAAVAARVFKDVYPASDGKLHLEFLSSWGRTAIRECAGNYAGHAGKLKPIRISAHQSGFVDADGTHWSGDNYFIEGRTILYRNPETGPRSPLLDRRTAR